MGHKKLAIASFILTLFLFNTMLVLSSDGGEVEDEREFNYEKGGKIGPENWWKIHKDWAICGKGKMQSPINIPDDRVMVNPHLGPLRRSYRPAPTVLKNRGHDIMLKWEKDAGSIWINETKYSLKQLHWHSPSEHTINGRRYSLEMHMVHESAKNQIAVVGILYKIGMPDSFLAKLEEYIVKLKNEEKVGIVDPRHIKTGGPEYYRYMGSLTTPPCTEGVVWTIKQEVQTVTTKQVQLLREAVHDGFDMNARPIQKTNGRVIGLYLPRRDNPNFYQTV